MDLATIIGLLVSTLLVVSAIVLGGSPIIFVDLNSMLIVVGGAIGATLVRNPLGAVLGTLAVVTKAFTTKIPAPDDLIGQILELARKARKESLLALEKVQVEYGFLAKAISLCVDGMPENEIRTILEVDMRATGGRHKRGQEILEGMGQAAPAFGMIGTLVGLVQMLAAMDDPSSIGPAMALALLTTLYGAVIANVFCLPLADKLKVRSKEEQLSMTLCMEGVIGMAQGVNPGTLAQQLQAFVSPKQRQEKPGAVEKAGAGEKA